MKKAILFSFAILISTIVLEAQSVKIGFRAGLNISSLNGPIESDDSGKALEEFSSNTGFLVGVSAAYPFLPYLGVRAEFLYSINGGRRLFESNNAFQKLTTSDNKSVLANGYKRYNLNTYNSHLQLPLSVYGKLWKKIELSAGICPSVLVSSTGTGEIKQIFAGKTNIADNTLVQELAYNFKSNEINSKSGNPVLFTLNTEEISTRSILTAYEAFDKKNGDFYNNFDLGFLAGISYYFNNSLFTGVRLYYGLKDVTNKEYDISLQKLDAGKYIKRDDFDRNIDWQLMIGFQF
jgi:hypothetical protein